MSLSHSVEGVHTTSQLRRKEAPVGKDTNRDEENQNDDLQRAKGQRQLLPKSRIRTHILTSKRAKSTSPPTTSFLVVDQAVEGCGSSDWPFSTSAQAATAPFLRLAFILGGRNSGSESKSDSEGGGELSW